MAAVERSRGIDRNFWLGVSNGVFVNGGEAFFNSSLVLAPFLAQLGASPIIIGLIPALRVGLFFLPQLLVANRLTHEPLKLKYYRITSTVRNVAFFVMTGVVLFASGLDPGFVVLVVVVMVAINAVSSGVGGVPFADVTAKIVPHARLGTFWAVRNVLGGAIALAAGFVLRAILDSDIEFPRNFGYIFLCGTVLATIGNASFSLVKEPPGEAGIRRPFLGMLKYVPSLLRTDALLRRFLRVRFLGLAALLAEPFYGIHALTSLEAPESALGLYIIAATVAAIGANFAFRAPANSGRNVMLLRIGYASYGLTLLSALFMKRDRYPSRETPAGITLTRAAADVLGELPLVKLPGASDRFMLEPAQRAHEMTSFALGAAPLELVLVLAQAELARIDLHEFAQRILNPPGRGNRPPGGGIGLGQLFFAHPGTGEQRSSVRIDGGDGDVAESLFVTHELPTQALDLAARRSTEHHDRRIRALGERPVYAREAAGGGVAADRRAINFNLQSIFAGVAVRRLRACPTRTLGKVALIGPAHAGAFIFGQIQA